MQNILVYGWYDKNNIGDESYKSSFPIILGGHNYYFKDKIIDGTDKIILGGGNILDPVWIDKLKTNKLKKYAFSVGSTSDLKKEDVDLFEKILVRDRRNYNKVKNITDRVELCPDFAFSLESKNNNNLEKLFIENNLDLYNKKILIIFNAHLNNRNNVNEFIHWLNACHNISKIIDSVSASFIFLPFCTSQPFDDRTSHGYIASLCKFWKKNLIVFDKLSVQNTLDIFSEVDLVISTRYHATLFSIIAGTPFIDLTHHDKNLGVLEDLNLLDYSLNYWDFKQEELKNKIEFLLNNKSNITKSLTNIRDQEKNKLFNIIKTISGDFNV